MRVLRTAPSVGVAEKVPRTTAGNFPWHLLARRSRPPITPYLINHGALFQSAVGKATLVDCRIHGDFEASFLAKVRFSHGKSGMMVCETGDSPAVLQHQLLE